LAELQTMVDFPMGLDRVRIRLRCHRHSRDPFVDGIGSTTVSQEKFTWRLVHVDKRSKMFPQLGRTGDVGGLPTGTRMSDDGVDIRERERINLVFLLNYCIFNFSITPSIL
jgi:hypothetical protein